jgi:phospholipid/cholesterol/gamma-HCH transport system substrate-binding protein
VTENTPINSATIATLQSQGVTGVSYVSLNGNDPDAPPLEPSAPGRPPVIPSEASVLETIIETAPELLREATDLLRLLAGFASAENQASVTGILSNVEQASSGLEQAIGDFSMISGAVREGASQISAFTERLEPISRAAETTLTTTNTALAAATAAFAEAQETLATATGALVAARATFANADALIADRAPAFIDSYEGAARAATEMMQTFGTQSGALIGRFGVAADLASARLREAEAPLAAATPALASVEEAADNFDLLMENEGTELIAEMRAAIADANKLIVDDASPILADARAAAAAVNRVVDQIGTDLTDVSGRLDGVIASAETTLADASSTFRAANATLAALDPAIASATRTLDSAQGAFGAADRVMSGELEPMVLDIRAAVEKFDAAMAQVSADLPAISAEVRSAAEDLQAMIARSAPGVETFATSALPQFNRLGMDARALVATLERLILRIERDPARFFLGGNTPEFRR